MKHTAVSRKPSNYIPRCHEFRLEPLSWSWGREVAHLYEKMASHPTAIHGGNKQRSPPSKHSVIQWSLSADASVPVIRRWVCFFHKPPVVEKLARGRWPQTPIMLTRRDVSSPCQSYATTSNPWSMTEMQSKVPRRRDSKGRWQ